MVYSRMVKKQNLKVYTKTKSSQSLSDVLTPTRFAAAQNNL